MGILTKFSVLFLGYNRETVEYTMNTPFLIDAHTHLQLRQFDSDRIEAIARTKEKNIWVINVGVDYESSVAAVELAYAQNNLQLTTDNLQRGSGGFFATVGLHPNDVADMSTQGQGDARTGEQEKRQGEEFDYEGFKELAKDSSVVGIGECGLDYYENSKFKIQKSKLQLKIQKDIFLQHIELAHEVRKPLMIHCRDSLRNTKGYESTNDQKGIKSAFEDLIEILKANRLKLKASSGVVHFFSGTNEDARALLDLGFSFTFGGVLTFTRDYDDVVQFLPLERLLLETDAPFVAPVPYRGRRNEPSYIIETAKRMAELKGITLEALSRQTTANAKRIFRI